ncbi:MAG: methyltransferase domain-containing protein, partial [Pseudomonadota bacterium]
MASDTPKPPSGHAERTDHKDHLSRVYGMKTEADSLAFYSDWAATYDAEVGANGYVTPERCAAALKRHAPATDLAILDIGCGTGLSGAAFATAGFTAITGTDINADMLEVARGRGVYGSLWVTDIDEPFPFATGTYGAIAAVGVIGSGAAPVFVLEGALDRLGPGGLCVFSFND